MTREQIDGYLDSHPEPKRSDLKSLHRAILELLPGCELWFLDGRDETGRVVSNPSVGYGRRQSTLASGKTKDFYQAGLSANTAGISVYIMGLEDRTYLPRTYGEAIGKATVTGYCIKFKRVSDIDVDVLLAAIRDGVQQTTDARA